MIYPTIEFNNAIMRFILSVLTLFLSTLAHAQTQFEFYSEAFTSLKSKSNYEPFPSFLTSYQTNNVSDLNLMLLKINHEQPLSKELPVSWGFNTGLMLGTYADQNLAAENARFRNFHELNAYVKWNNQYKFEYGILPSHIGFESAIGKESWAATRSILADNSPYYEYGYRLSYTSKSGALKANLNAIKGWQNISNPIPGRYAIGHQITLTEKDEFTINSSSYYGVSPSNPKNQRFFHNFYAQFYFGKHIAWILGFDNGIEIHPNGHRDQYHAPVGILKYSVTKDFSLTGRYEYFNDPHLIFNIAELFNVHGYSINADFAINKQILLRFENRWFVITENKNGVETDYRSPFYPKLILCAQFK